MTDTAYDGAAARRAQGGGGDRGARVRLASAAAPCGRAGSAQRQRNRRSASDDRVAHRRRRRETISSWCFIIQRGILVCWIAVNVVGFVRYPFSLLDLALSLQAAYAAPIITISRNRQAAKARLHAEEDFCTNVLAERETAMPREIRAALPRDGGNCVRRSNG